MIDMIPNIEPSAELWAAGLWRASWQGGIALAIAWAIARWCTFISPRVVCWVWRLACVKLLVALAWVEPVSLALLPAKPLADPIAEVAPANSAAAVASRRLPAVRAVTSSPQQPRSPIGGTSLLATVWLLGASAFFLLSARQWNAARRLVARASARPNGRVQQWFRQEADRMNIRRPPPLAISCHVDSPLLAGVWQQIIILPDAADERFDERELRLMLSHELAHYRRCDLAWNWLPTVVRWLFWFHPLVWVTHRLWSESQEAACDELLIQSCAARPAEYGRLLLKVATVWPPQACSSLAVAGVLGTYRNLERRILTMSRIRPHSPLRLAFMATIVAIVAASGTVPWKLVAQEPDPNAIDQKAMQGTWLVRDFAQVNHTPGDEERAAWRAGQLKVSIVGDRITMWDDSKLTYTLDAAKQPKQMKVRVHGPTNEVDSRAIYSLQANTLKICLARSSDEGTPVDFDVEKAPAGTFPVCFTLQRAGAEPADNAAAEADPQAMAKARTEAFDQLKRIGLAMHNYHDEHKRFPAPSIVDETGTPLLSWRVMLLPYLDQEALYNEFHLNEPWDSPHNKALIAKVPADFRCPASKAPAGSTVYLAATGDSTAFPRSQRVTVRDIIDGTSCTIAVVEVDDDHAVPWTKPEDWNFIPQYPNVGLGGHFKDVFLCLFCDASAHAIPPGIKKETLQAIFTRNGREPLPNPLHP